MKVGFIGLGIMGKPMALNLARKGQDLMVSDLNKAAVDELVAAGAKAGTNKEIAESCDAVVTIVPTGAISRSIMFGEGGLADYAKPGTIFMDMSSVTPPESVECYEKAKAKGIRFLDAPVSGGEPKAIDGTLAIMVGGDQDAFDEMQEVFEKIGSSAKLIGKAGSGSVCKLANQIIVNNTIAIVSEAMVFATKAGADPLKVFEAIRGGLAGSCVLDAKVPMMAARNFVPGGTIKVNHKDIKNVLATAHELDIPVPYSAQLFEIMQTLKVGGHIMDDHSGIVQYFEMLAGVEVKSDTQL